MFKPSKYQQAIFDWTENRSGINLVVEAVAGSGKTTTSVKALDKIPSNETVAFLAFNKHIATELQSRVPQNVSASTYHSLGFQACRNALGTIKVDNRKIEWILRDNFDRYEYGKSFYTIYKLVSLLKANNILPDDQSLMDLIDYHDIDFSGNGDIDLGFILDATKFAFEESIRQTWRIDFDDMCYLPIHHQFAMPKFNVIIVDELQDTNPIQVELALRATTTNSRIIGVGDRKQSIYGFRGADVNAIPNLVARLQADTLPLSITYRNPLAIVSLVNDRFPEIPFEASDFAKDGKIEYISPADANFMYQPGDMILCRCNAPLVRPCFNLIKRGIKAIIKGRNIGEGLTYLVKKMKGNDIYTLLKNLEEYKIQETSKFMAAERYAKAALLEDKVETIFALSDGVSTIDELLTRIDTVFSDEVESVTFSSIHKAKGLEAQRVFILEPQLLPHPAAKRDWEQQQERNIEYVAYTRSLNELYIVG